MQNSAAFKAGVFILLMTALAVGMVVLIADAGRFGGGSTAYVVRFDRGDDIAGLKPDAQVRIFGVPVGSVASVEVVPHDELGAVVEVGVRVPSEFVLRGDAVVVADASLTGDAWLNIESLGSGDALAGGATLDGRSRSLGKVVDAAGSLVPEVRALFARAESSLGKIEEATEEVRAAAATARGALPPLVERAQQIGDDGAAFMADARDLLGDTKADLRTTIATLRHAIATADEKLPPLLDKADTVIEETRRLLADTRKGLERLPEIMDRVRTAVDDGGALLTRANALVADNRPKIDRTLTSLSRAAEEVRGASAELRAAPWRLLYRPDERDEGNLALYALARQYAYGAADLEEAAAALEAASQRPNVNEEDLRALEAALRASFDRFDRVQAALWERFEE